MSRRRLGLRKRLALNIFSDLYASKVREHRLDTLFWECTLRCNLSCRHCGSDCRVDPGVADMPLGDFLKVLDEEVTPHVDPADVLIIFSGGEVLVRADLEEACRREGLRLFMPPLKLCGDNGAMIGAQGYYEYLAGRRAGLDLNAYATMDLGEAE